MRNLKLVFISLFIIALTSCTTTVKVDLSDKNSKIELLFRDEAKQALIDDPVSDQQLLEFLSDLSSNPAERIVEKDFLKYTTYFNGHTIPPELSSVKISNSNQSQVSIEFMKPTKLVKAISLALKGKPGGDLLTSTYFKNIIFNVNYSTTNLIKEVRTADGKAVKHGRHSVSFAYPLSEVPKGSITVYSTYDYSFIYFMLLALLFAAGLYKYVVKRRK